MATKERATNPTRAEGRNCTKCGRVFTTALDRRKECVKCRPVNGVELAELMGGGMNGAEMAASMIRAGAKANAAFFAASRHTGESFRDIAKECARRSAARRHSTSGPATVPLWRQMGKRMVGARIGRSEE